MNAEVARRLATWQSALDARARPEVIETARARYLAAVARQAHQEAQR